MMNLICSLFFIISVSMLVHVLDTNCSGINEDDMDWNKFSPIVDLPDIDEQYDRGRRSQNVETPFSSSQSSHSSPVYSFYGDEDWNQDQMETKLINEGEFWEEIKANAGNKTMLTQTCAKFSWEFKEVKYKKYCFSKRSYAMNYYGSKKKKYILLKNRSGSIVIDRVMLSCFCYDKNTRYGDRIDEHYFAVAKHSNNSYYLFKYESEDEYPYLYGFVQNFIC